MAFGYVPRDQPPTLPPIPAYAPSSPFTIDDIPKPSSSFGAGPNGCRPQTLTLALTTSTAKKGLAAVANDVVNQMNPIFAARRPHIFLKPDGGKRLISVADPVWAAIEKMATGKLPRNRLSAPQMAIKRCAAARRGDRLIALDITAAYANLPHDRAIAACARAGWPSQCLKALSLTLSSPIICNGTPYYRQKGGAEGSPLVQLAFETLMEEIAHGADRYADDIILDPDQAATVIPQILDAGFAIKTPKCFTINCDITINNHPIPNTPPPDAMMLGVPINPHTPTKLEKRITHILQNPTRQTKHTVYTLVTAAAESAHYTLATCLTPAMIRIDALLRHAESLFGLALPARLSSQNLWHQRRITTTALLAKLWPTLSDHDRNDPWVSDAIHNAAALGLTLHPGSDTAQLHSSNIPLASITETTLRTKPTPPPDINCVETALHTTGPRLGISDTAFDWIRSNLSQTLAQHLISINGDLTCRLCNRQIDTDHVTTCAGIGGERQGYTHNHILRAIHKHAASVGISHRTNQQITQDLIPDLIIDGKLVEIKTLVQDAHANWRTILRTTIRDARGKYATKAPDYETRVIGLTTRGTVVQECIPDMQALAAEIESHAWRPTPPLATIIGVAIAEAAAKRQTAWTNTLSQNPPAQTVAP